MNLCIDFFDNIFYLKYMYLILKLKNLIKFKNNVKENNF